MKLAGKFSAPQNLGTGDINYYKEEVQRLKRLAVQEIDMDLIDLKENVRKEYNQESIGELAMSIKEHSLLNPVQVAQEGSRYRLVAGYRRYHAHKLLGWENIRAFVVDLNEKNITVLQLVENVQRENLSPYDLELCVQAFAEEGYTYDEIAGMVKKSKSWVSGILASKQIREHNMALLKEH